jgi:ligand-binding sensor domain-containing protein/putative methionine-R-sulfoxide reductase with GAF domain
MKTMYIYFHTDILKRGIKHICVLFALLVCRQLIAVAQLPTYHVRMLTSQQGLATAEVLSMAKDKKGFLWLVSQNLVQRYDGKLARRFEFDETASEIFIDSRDRKWVMGRTGIFIFKNDLDGFVKSIAQNDSLKSPVCMFEKNGILHLLLADGLRFFDETRQQFVKPAVPYFSFPKKLQGYYSKSGNYLFVSTTDSLYQINVATGSKTAVSFRSLFFMLATGNDELVVSNWDAQTFIINFSTGRQRPVFPKDINGGAISAKLLRFFGGSFVSEGRFLFASYNGMVEYNAANKTFQHVSIYHQGRPLVTNNNSRFFYRDKNASLYFTHPDGICFFNSSVPVIQHIREYSWHGTSLPDMDVRGFAESGNGKMWIATVMGIAALDMNTGKLETFTPVKEKDAIHFPSIRYLLFAGKKFWVGTGGEGLWLMDTITKKFNRPVFDKDSTGIKTAKLLNDDFIWKLEPLRNGEVFVCGENHCYLVNSSTYRVQLLPMLKNTGASRCALQDSEGRIWYGTTRGVYCYSEGFQLLFAIRDSLPDKRVASLAELTPGHILIGSKGVFDVIVKNNTIHAFKPIAALPANKLYYCMQKDAAGNVWLGANDGLLKYRQLEGIVDFFDAADNVQPQAFNSNGLYLSKNNWVFAGGKAGFNYFEPMGIRKATPALQPVVVSLSAGNNDSIFYKQSPPYTTEYRSNHFAIDISAPEFVRPFALQYRYRLGNSAEWIVNGSSSIRLTNLPPGNYSFQPSVSYDGRRWFDSDERIGLRVLKPWWQQWWFRALCVAAVTLLWYLYKKYKQRQRIADIHQQTIDYFANSGHEYSSTDDILWDITRNCISRLGFEDCVIYLVDEERNTLRQHAAYGAKSPKHFEIINPIEIPIGKGITGHVAQTGIAEIIADTSKDKRYIVDDEIRYSEIVVPIIHNEKTIGVIDSEHRHKSFFTNQHLATLQTIASICAGKISLTLATERMRQAVRQVEDVNSRMTETKFINLRLQMNPHFLFNSLSSIQHLIVSKQTNEAYKYLSVFSTFLRSVLQYADKTFISLDDEVKMLNMYIRLEALGFDETFSYDIKVDENLDTEDVLIPPLMVQPLIENAIWHGLIHKNGNKHFSVSFINNDDEHLLCIVEDNGVGRQQAANIIQSSLNSFTYQSKATTLIKERLEVLKQKTGKEASMKTEDISPSGTRVQLVIPYYNNDEL